MMSSLVLNNIKLSLCLRYYSHCVLIYPHNINARLSLSFDLTHGQNCLVTAVVVFTKFINSRAWLSTVTNQYLEKSRKSSLSFSLKY